jgi:hypothetical protein
MKKVMVATPSHSGDVCCDYAIAMMEIFRLAKERGYELCSQFWMYNSIVAESRNILIGMAYAGEFDAMVFIDADQGFSADAFFKLLDHPVDVVGYPVRMKRLDKEVYNVMPNDDFSKYVTHPELKLINVPAIGTGFLKLSKAAIAALWDNSRKYHNYGVDIPHVCQVAFDGGMLMSEDLYLCKRVKELGFSIFVDPSYTADHFGRTKFSGNYAAHLLNRMTTKE